MRNPSLCSTLCLVCGVHSQNWEEHTSCWSCSAVRHCCMLPIDSAMTASSSGSLLSTTGGCSCAVGAAGASCAEAYVRTSGTRMRVPVGREEKLQTDASRGFACSSLPFGLALHDFVAQHEIVWLYIGVLVNTSKRYETKTRPGTKIKVRIR